MRVVSVTGITGSGKTTTVEKIIAGLKGRRYSVGSVKDIHYENFAIDTPGSNTDRHRQAGAELVTARGHAETDLLFPDKLPVQQILSFYTQEWVVLEGVSDANVPKIICGHTKAELDQRLDPSVIGFAGIIGDSLGGEYRGLPVFNALTAPEALVEYVEKKVPRLLPDFSQDCCGLCGMSCRELLGLINSGKGSRQDCILEQRVELKIGGQALIMVPFVQEVLIRTLVGLVSTLDGYQPGQSIEISLKND